MTYDHVFDTMKRFKESGGHIVVYNKVASKKPDSLLLMDMLNKTLNKVEELNPELPVLRLKGIDHPPPDAYLAPVPHEHFSKLATDEYREFFHGLLTIMVRKGFRSDHVDSSIFAFPVSEE